MGSNKKVTAFRLIISTIVLIVVMIAYVFLYTEKVRALEVLSGSMEPTIQRGDRLLVMRSYDRELERGEIVVLESPDDDGPDLVKRVIGLPGDELQMKHEMLWVNGELNKTESGRPYFHPDTPDFQFTLGDGDYFVLGDNRGKSHDSTEFGPVRRELINGKVFYRYGPLDRRGTLE